MNKLLIVTAAGVGYVLGAKAGRERYEQIRGTFQKVKNDPRVQEKAHQAADLAREQAPVVKEKIASAADTASAKVKTTAGGGNHSSAADQLNPESTIFQEDPGPKGDLP